MYSSYSLLSLKFRLPFCKCLKIFHSKDFQPLVESGNVVLAAWWYLSQKYLAIRQRTCSKQRMKIWSVANQLCCLENENARWRHAELRLLEFLYGLLLGNCGYQTDRKIYDQGEIALRLRSSRDKRTARATKL